MKTEIDMAIITASAPLTDDWDFYISILPNNEAYEECEAVKEALAVLNSYGIGFDALARHVARRNNVDPEPVRFIDRCCFAPIETDELPF